MLQIGVHQTAIVGNHSPGLIRTGRTVKQFDLLFRDRIDRRSGRHAQLIDKLWHVVQERQKIVEFLELVANFALN